MSARERQYARFGQRTDGRTGLKLYVQFQEIRGRFGQCPAAVGAERFGARQAAGNPVGDIAELCKYAHTFGAKVYVTVNTIIYDDELKGTEELIWRLYDVGVDAILVQDMGILEMNLPPIDLHASTQTDNGILRSALLRARSFSKAWSLFRYISMPRHKPLGIFNG